MRRTRLLAALTLAACASAPRADFTEAELSAAAPQGFDATIRVYADAAVEDLTSLADAFLPPPRAEDGAPSQFIALSGGGPSGAFGAGALAGWRAAGTRPDFDLVTGISTGALIAPFAFLGTEADDEQLRHLFTSGVAEGLGERRFILFGLMEGSLVDGDQLHDLIEDNVDQPLLRRIAARHREGARLHVVTTDLDAQRSVIWNMGAIAQEDDEAALALFREVLAASASIPGVFPAVKIETVTGGKTITELHVDGSTVRSVFLFPDASDAAGYLPRVLRDHPAELTVIMNGTVDPVFEETNDSTLGVAGRALETLLMANARNSIEAISTVAEREGLPFRLLYVDEVVDIDTDHPFAPQPMRKLYELGYEKAATGAWQDGIGLGRVLGDSDLAD